MVMALIKPLMNITHGSIEPSFCIILFHHGSYISILFSPTMARVVTHDGMVIVSSKSIQDNKLWGVRRGGQITNRVSMGHRNGRWKYIWGISGSCVWYVTNTKRYWGVI